MHAVLERRGSGLAVGFHKNLSRRFRIDKMLLLELTYIGVVLSIRI